MCRCGRVRSAAAIALSRQDQLSVIASNPERSCIHEGVDGISTERCAVLAGAMCKDTGGATSSSAVGRASYADDRLSALVQPSCAPHAASST